MADDSGFWTSNRLFDADGAACLPLSSATAPDRRLVARCVVASCRRRSPIDPTHWTRLRLGDLPLRALEGRLRCLCGARQGVFEIWSRPGLAETSPVGLYAFH